MDHQFIKGRDIIMFSFQPWDVEIGSNFKDMAIELAKYNRVLFVNRALERKSLMNQKDPIVKTRLASIREGVDELVEIRPNLWVQNPRVIVESINWIPVHFVHDYINKINNKRIAREINKAIGRLGFTKVILMNDNDFIRGYYMGEMIPTADRIFYIRDFLLSVDFFQRHGHRLEAGLMEKSDMVVANSSYLAEYARKFNRNCFDIGQGCDVDVYRDIHPPVPADLKGIKRPIIGYTGFVGRVRLDEQIIEHLAQQLSDCSIVLIGPEDEHFSNSHLRRSANVHFLGKKDPGVLPDYIYHFDICINPQVVNQLTIGNYPRKVDEYLALGKPVVATKTEAMEMFAEFTYLCVNKEEYVRTIRDLIASGAYKDPELAQMRREFAFTHTWERSVGLLGDAYHQNKTN